VPRHSAYKAFFAAIFSILGFSAHAVPSYTILDLGTLAGATSRGNGVNDSGQVTGGAQAVYDPMTGGYFSHAFVWDKASGMTDLGTITGSWWSGGNAINNDGQVTGQSALSYLFSTHAFVWDSMTGMIDLGTLGGGTGTVPYSNSHGSGINDSGVVTGTSITNEGIDHAFLWDAVNGMVDLGPLGLGSGRSSGNGINDSGMVTGSYSVSSPLGDVSHAYVWDAVNGVIDIGTLGGLSSVGIAINDIGQVAGYYSLYVPDPAHPGPIHAFIWDAASGMMDLGTLGGVSSYPDAINDAGQVVGRSEIVGDAVPRAFLWDPVDGMLNLQDLVADFSDWEYLESAEDISNTGYITGYG
jgi:probable HAF family extracellular repeat protein